MEYQKIVNLLDTASDNNDLPRFATKNDNSLLSIRKNLWHQEID